MYSLRHLFHLLDEYSTTFYGEPLGSVGVDFPATRASSGSGSRTTAFPLKLPVTREFSLLADPICVALVPPARVRTLPAPSRPDVPFGMGRAAKITLILRHFRPPAKAGPRSHHLLGHPLSFRRELVDSLRREARAGADWKTPPVHRRHVSPDPSVEIVVRWSFCAIHPAAKSQAGDPDDVVKPAAAATSSSWKPSAPWVRDRHPAHRERRGLRSSRSTMQNFVNVSTAPGLLENAAARRLFATPGVGPSLDSGWRKRASNQPFAKPPSEPTSSTSLSASTDNSRLTIPPSLPHIFPPPPVGRLDKRESSVRPHELVILSAAGRLIAHVCEVGDLPDCHHTYPLRSRNTANAARSALLRARGNSHLIVGHRLPALFAAINLAFPAYLCLDLDVSPCVHRYFNFLFSTNHPQLPLATLFGLRPSQYGIDLRWLAAAATPAEAEPLELHLAFASDVSCRDLLVEAHFIRQLVLRSGLRVVVSSYYNGPACRHSFSYVLLAPVSRP